MITRFPVLAALALCAAAVVFAPSPTAAQATASAATPLRSTNLPLPRFVSIKGAQASARRGPGWDHRVDWVYQRRDLPLLVTAEFEHWRRVEDVDGEGGWIHFSLLSGVRTVLVTRPLTPLRRLPQPDSLEVALLENGVIARILECNPAWCRLSVEGERGWAERDALWGLLPGETLD